MNRPPSASNRGLAVGPVGTGPRGTAIIGGAGMVDPAASRGAFSLNIHGTNGKYLYFVQTFYEAAQKSFAEIERLANF